MLEDGNLYIYVNGDPVNWIDPLGLAKCYYLIGYHSLVVIADDGKSRVVIGPGGIFSGSNEYMNDPSFSGERGPIKPGIYKMVPSSKFGGSYWLDEGRRRRFLYKLGLGRGEFFLHLGTYSLGCITVDKNNPEAVEQFEKIKNILEKDKHNSLEVLPW